MQIRWIENLSAEDRLKIKAFLGKLSSALLDAGGQGALNLEYFLESPLRFSFAPPSLTETHAPFVDLISYEGGTAYFTVPAGEPARNLISFDWDTLYSELSAGTASGLLASFDEKNDPQNLFVRGRERRLNLTSVASGQDLLVGLAHASWKFLRLFPIAGTEAQRFKVFLPVSYYPYLVEPATTASQENIRAELSVRLGIDVVLSPSLSGEGVLVYESSLQPASSAQPICFLGVGEDGGKRLYVYFREPAGAREIPFLRLGIRKSFFRRFLIRFGKGCLKLVLWLVGIPLVWELYTLVRPTLGQAVKFGLELVKSWL